MLSLRRSSCYFHTFQLIRSFAIFELLERFLLLKQFCSICLDFTGVLQPDSCCSFSTQSKYMVVHHSGDMVEPQEGDDVTLNGRRLGEIEREK